MKTEAEAKGLREVSDVSYLIARYKSARRKDQKDILNVVSKRLKAMGVGEDRAIQRVLGLTVAAE